MKSLKDRLASIAALVETVRDTLSRWRGGKRYVFDIETNGLLIGGGDRVHCAVLYDIDTDEIIGFRPNELGKFLKLYRAAEVLIGHNIIGFDIPFLQRTFGFTPNETCEIIDTLPLARLVYSDIKGEDFPRAKAWKKFKEARDAWAGPGEFRSKAPLEFPGQFVGSHSLEAWGYRLGSERKGDYSKEMKEQGLDPWASFNEAMFDYMLQDARVNVALFRHLMAQEPAELSIVIEMDTQALCCRMERNGWPLDVEKASELYSRLAQRRTELERTLKEVFPPWEVRLEDFVPKRDNKKLGYVKDVPVPRWETKEFNPASRDHIADRLINKYGWEPREYTDGGSAKIDDEVLTKLPYPEAKLLAEYFLIQKRIGQIGEGNQAWLKQVSKKGKIHARYNTGGTVTGRMSHSSPNIAQVPSVGAAYGRDCRVLFTVPRGWVQLGADQSGLELRCLGSFMAAFDAGAYIQVVLNGDVHWENAKALFGLPDDTVRDEKGNPKHKQMRDVAKTFIYAFLYGAGDAKLGSIIGKGAKAGAQLRARFLKKFPALARLIKAVQAAAKKGWLKGLDGRKIPVRSEHAALNSLLQSAGAVICKRWMTLADQMLRDAGLVFSEALNGDWDPEANIVMLGAIHDEGQWAVKPDVADKAAAIIQEAGRLAGNIFQSWKCPTDVETKLGTDWAACH